MESDILYGTAYSGVSGIYDACGKETSFLFADRIVFGNIYRRNFLLQYDLWNPGGRNCVFYLLGGVYCRCSAVLLEWIKGSGIGSGLLHDLCCGMQHIAFDMYIIFQIAWGESFAVPIIIFVIVYVLFYIFLARRLTHRGRFIVTRRSLFSMLTIVMLVWMLSIMNNSGIDGFEAGIWQQVIYRMTDGLCCFYVLWVQLNQKENLSLQRELDGIRFMWQQQERQYEITSDTIENINRKCHDLKYQIHNLSDITDETEKREYLQELERDIMIYDVSLQTGNRALDVVLMEKGLFCKNHEIQWSCMVDGSRMNFMKAEDIYGIFGNALDNAIEAVSRLEDPQQRVISVKAIYQKKILVIQFQNYYQGDLEFRNGIPRTTKQNKQDHGYGMKSIRYTVEKYNGTVTVSTKNNIFTLQILIPLA